MKKLSKGITDFRELKKWNCVYLDKTEHIYKMAEDTKYTSLSRPRRFGKSLTISVLEYLFKGANISSETVFLFLIFNVLLFANFEYVGDYGVKPVPEEWINKSSVEKSEVRFFFSPALYYANWSSNVVTKYGGWWGVPTNPAQNVFYLQDELPELLKAVFNYVSDGFCFYIELPLEKEYVNRLATLYTGHNVPIDFSVDLNFPKRAYLYYVGENFYVSVGRYKLSWGDAKYPVHISPTTTLDNLTCVIKFPEVNYTFHAISSYPLLALQEYNIQKSYSDQHTAGMYFYEPSKYIFAHRLDFYGSIGSDFKTRIGLSELNIVGGKFPDLIDLNPVLIYHNTYGEGFSNVTGGIDFSLTYTEKIKLYGEIVIDDVRTFTESGSSYKPGAQAYNIGGNVNIQDMEFWVEYSETSEWMYVTNHLPYLRINVRKFFIQNVPGGRYMPDYPLGFIYGPDAKMFSFGINGKLKEFDLSYSLEYNRLIKGQVNDNDTIRWKWFWDSWPYNVTESGAVMPVKAEDAVYNIFSFELKWKNFSIFGKSVNFNNYIFGLILSL